MRSKRASARLTVVLLAAVAACACSNTTSSEAYGIGYSLNWNENKKILGGVPGIIGKDPVEISLKVGGFAEMRAEGNHPPFLSRYELKSSQPGVVSIAGARMTAVRRGKAMVLLYEVGGVNPSICVLDKHKRCELTRITVI